MKFLATIYLLFLIPSFFAKADDTLDLFELSLEELIQVQVEVASKVEQPLSESPAVVTTYTAKEISMFGGRDIGEVLSRLPGFEEYSSLYNGRNIVTIRADQLSVNNNHVLFLLNGVPLNRESYTGGIWNEAMLQTIPLNSIQQIELIRGPGSVLYGTNAFSGVVNIITKKSDRLSPSISVDYGRYNTEQIQLELSGQAGDWQLTSALQWKETDGWPYKTVTSDNSLFMANASSKSSGIIATATNNNFSANLYWGQVEQFTTRGNVTRPEAGETDNEKYSLNLAYESEINKQWSINSYLSHVSGRTIHQVSTATPGQLNTINYHTDDSRLEINSRGVLSANSNILVGGTIDYFSGSTPGAISIVSDWYDYYYGLYAQYDIRIDDTQYIIGAQYNNASGNYESLVPRIGLIHHLNSNSGIKLLYGQAYRTPYIVERKINVAIANLSIKGDENLAPELVSTWDFQYFYNGENLTAAATIFRNEQKDLIIRAPVAPQKFVFKNKGRLTIEGLELESKYTQGNWYGSGSITFQQNKDGNAIDDFTLQPHRIVKLGLGYSSEKWSVGIFDSYLSAYQDNIIHKPNRPTLNPKSDAYHRISANLAYHPENLNDWSFELYIDNLLDESIYLPAQLDDGTNINTKLGLTGRFIMFRINKRL